MLGGPERTRTSDLGLGNHFAVFRDVSRFTAIRQKGPSNLANLAATGRRRASSITSSLTLL